MKFKSRIDAYGHQATSETNSTILNGRYSFQANSELLIPDDVKDKLLLNKNDNVLDIGCGSGDVALHISKDVNTITVCDHRNLIQRLKKINKEKNFKYVPVSFLDFNFGDNKYSKILIYSVVQTFSTREELFKVLSKIKDLLLEGGRILIGDIPNNDKLNRFLSTKRGEIFSNQWQKLKKENNLNEVEVTKFVSNENTSDIDLNDKLIFDILKYFRESGFNSYLLEQKHNLPFGNSREDIIVCHSDFYL
ncbi:MAG: hypothetical protein CBB97_14990 [Candidatus Endolissoclinum sp. TMED37]|nr:MAG: hypothetical protein CBB97_14990 [Candidatus Endolissoclinum sp. TMED37]|tara:strand:+ start:1157 stop:1903 length:747 start_codon:yes stop_codon:yes gene_type:complete